MPIRAATRMAGVKTSGDLPLPCIEDVNAAAALQRNSHLPRVWRYQEFSAWMTDTMHDAGDPTLNGPFRQMTARARLDEVFSSSTAGRLHSDYQRGIA